MNSSVVFRSVFCPAILSRVLFWIGLAVGSAAFLAHAQTVVHWQGGSGDWSDPDHWDAGVVPNDAGGVTYVAVVDLATEDPVVTVTGSVTVSGLVQGETLRVETGGLLVLTGGGTNTAQIIAGGGGVRLAEATLKNDGGTLVAEGGTLQVVNSELSNGTLRVTDDATSLVRFSGDVTMNGVVWEDLGAGEFQVYNTTVRFLGDYADQLPSGYHLVMVGASTHTPAVLTFAGGTFTNDGLIELRHGGGGWQGFPTLHWEADGTLAGSGEVFLTGAGDDNRWTAAEGVTVTIGPSQWVHGRGLLQLDVVNEGLLEADIAGKRLEITGLFHNAATGSVQLVGGSRLILYGALLDSDLVASTGSTIRIGNARVTMNTHAIVADGGTVEILNSELSNGTLRVTDDATSLVRFSGDVTMNGVVWEDLGAGEFQVYNTTVRFLGDYADQLPSGYHLVVVGASTHTPAVLTFAGGTFTNDGMIELRHGGGGWQGFPTLHWEADGTLAGSGEVFLTGAGDDNRWTAAEGVTVTIGPSQWVHGRGLLQLDVVNEGVLEADIAGKRLEISGLLHNTATGTVQCLAGGRLILSGGILEEGLLTVSAGELLTLSTDVGLGSDLVATTGSRIRIENATVAMNTHAIVADGGTVEILNSELSNGTLRVTDDAASLVRFSGEVTLNGVPWEDVGSGEFQVYNTTVRFLGDYADQLPSGYHLVVVGASTHTPATLILAGGTFTNDGMIELRHGGGGWQGFPTLHWEADGTLAGLGEVFLTGAGDDNRWTAAEGVTVTIGPSQWVHGRGLLQLDVVSEGILEADMAGKRLEITGRLHNTATGIVQCLSGGRLLLSGGILEEGSLTLDGGELLGLSSTVSLGSDLVATTGSRIRIENATVAMNTHAIVGDGGTVEILNSELNNGTLRVTDDVASLVRFSGEMSLNGVPWEDLGSGEFQVLNTTVRFLGDYADQLPSGYHLVVVGASTHTPATLILAGGIFTNDGMIELRHGGGGWQGFPTLHWETDGMLAGSGEVFMTGAGDDNRWTAAEGVTVTIGPGQWVHGRGLLRMDVVNEGLLEADLTGKRLEISGFFRNVGEVRVLDGSKLVFQRDLRNGGWVRVDGGQVDVNASVYCELGARFDVLNGGVISVNRHLFGTLSGAGAFAESADLTLDGDGTPLPDLSADAYFIEAEDFNFDRGLHEPVADVMPYGGGAYAGRAGRDRIDYHQVASEPQGDVYRVGEGPGVNVGIAVLNEVERGSYRAETNHVVGWNHPDEWYNYTRVFPAPAQPSYLFARLSSGGQPNAIQIDEVVGPASTTSQSLNKVGEARGPASGNWGVYRFVPVRDEGGDLVQFEWSGEVTFRVTILPDGQENLDYFVLAPVLSSGPAQLLEVMGEDLGQDLAGFVDNFALRSLQLGLGSHVQLVDREDNAPGAGAEALYLEQLVVPDGAILDLSGIRLYTREAWVEGSILNGTVLVISPEAPVLRIRSRGADLEIAWPADAGGFVLHKTSDWQVIDSWEPVAVSPVVEGNENIVREPWSAAAVFYRLIHN